MEYIVLLITIAYFAGCCFWMILKDKDGLKDCNGLIEKALLVSAYLFLGGMCLILVTILVIAIRIML